jgi:hypothetical protein
MSFRIVPAGTPGAIPLKEAMEIQLRKMGLHCHSEKTRQRLAYTARRSWRLGYFDGASKKQAETLRRYHGKPCRGRRDDG